MELPYPGILFSPLLLLPPPPPLRFLLLPLLHPRPIPHLRLSLAEHVVVGAVTDGKNVGRLPPWPLLVPFHLRSIHHDHNENQDEGQRSTGGKTDKQAGRQNNKEINRPTGRQTDNTREAIEAEG